eukprot:GILI01005857.1.p1 GENE.GILI01005857.1~~GILI01005857.1.p1  ORF type:complete len:557 (+),score=127.86 GILI01005857.1:57-1673(+)
MGESLSKDKKADGQGHPPLNKEGSNGFLNRSNFVVSHSGQIQAEWNFEKELGAGGYGKVYLASNKRTGVQRAIKTISKRKIDKKDMKKLNKEIDLLRSLDHPNIIRLYETWQDNVNLYLVMELCSGGELFERIYKSGSLSEKDAAVLMKQILSGLRYCHAHNVVHRDLKLENFLYESKAPDAQLKLIDFGLAKMVGSNGLMHTARTGTTGYWAPEVCSSASPLTYTNACDMWSVGVCLFILLSGRPPFALNDSSIPYIMHGRFSMSGSEWNNISDSAKDLVRNLLQVDPSHRLTAEQAYSHPWVQTLANNVSVPLQADNLTSLQAFYRHEKFKKAVLTVMASQLTQDEMKGLRDIFVSLDKNGDGTLTLSELMEGLTTLGVSFLQHEVEDIMQALDTDGSGSIDYTEFLAATMQKQLYLQEDRLLAAFKIFDKDESGKISASELKEVLCGSGRDIDRAVFQNMIAEVDLNGDGEIDIYEFQEMMMKNSEALSRSISALTTPSLSRHTSLQREASLGAPVSSDFYVTSPSELTPSTPSS